MTLQEPAEPHISVLYDDTRRDLRDPSAPRPVRLYVWEPVRRVTDAGPLVVVSHGTGGSGSAMNWLVRPLVEAGLRVVALDHHGNNFVDGYEPEGFVLGWERPGTSPSRSTRWRPGNPWDRSVSPGSRSVGTPPRRSPGRASTGTWWRPCSAESCRSRWFRSSRA